MEEGRDSFDGPEEEWQGARERDRSNGPRQALQQITALLRRNVIVRAQCIHLSMI